MPTATFGNLMLTLGGIQTLSFLVLGTGYSTRWHYRFAPMFIVQLLTILSFLGIWSIQNTPLWTFMFGLIGVSAAFTYFSSLYYGLDRHADKGNKSGWHEGVLGLGILLGPAVRRRFGGFTIRDTESVSALRGGNSDRYSGGDIYFIQEYTIYRRFAMM